MCQESEAYHEKPRRSRINHFGQKGFVVFVVLREFVKRFQGRTERSGPRRPKVDFLSRMGTYVYSDVECSAVRMLLLYQDLQGPRAIGPGVRLADSRSIF